MLGVPLWSALSAMVIISLALKDGSKARAALILLTDWIVCTLLALATGSQYLWHLLILIDFIAALVLLLIPTSRWNAAIGFMYVVEILAHCALGISGETAASRYHYWYTLHYLAWTQAALMLGWIVYDGGRQVYSNHCRHLRGLPSVSEMLIRMGQRP
jgi:hypothetical protein